MSALISPGLQTVSLSGESPGGRGMFHYLSTWETPGEAASEIHPGWEWKIQGLIEMIWDSLEGILGREGEKCTASCLKWWTKQQLKDIRGMCRMGAIQFTVSEGPEPTKQGSRDRPGRTQIIVAKGFFPCLWLLCSFTQLFWIRIKTGILN